MFARRLPERAPRRRWPGHRPSPAVLPLLCSAVVSTAVLFVLAATTLVAPARATTFADVTLEDLAKASDVIVLGRVVSTTVEPEGPAGLPGIHTRVELVADEFLAGDPVSVVTFWVHGGQLGDRLRVIPGQARFAVGEEVGVFLFRTEDGVLFPTGMGRGKWTLDRQGRLGPTVPGLVNGPLTIRELRGRVRGGSR